MSGQCQITLHALASPFKRFRIWDKYVCLYYSVIIWAVRSHIRCREGAIHTYIHWQLFIVPMSVNRLHITHWNRYIRTYCSPWKFPFPHLINGQRLVQHRAEKQCFDMCNFKVNRWESLSMWRQSLAKYSFCSAGYSVFWFIVGWSSSFFLSLFFSSRSYTTDFNSYTHTHSRTYNENRYQKTINVCLRYFIVSFILLSVALSLSLIHSHPFCFAAYGFSADSWSHVTYLLFTIISGLVFWNYSHWNACVCVCVSCLGKTTPGKTTFYARRPLQR